LVLLQLRHGSTHETVHEFTHEIVTHEFTHEISTVVLVLIELDKQSKKPTNNKTKEASCP
jgi:hypothetical protein